MIATCANPNCMAEFRYQRRGGRLVAVDTDSTDWGTGRPRQRRHLYWLCEQCAASFDLTVMNGVPTCISRSQFHCER
jgi:hypothetical protein